MINKITAQFFIFLLFFSLNANSGDHSVLEITDNDFYIGDIDAPITIIEYASMSVSYTHLTLPTNVAG